MRERLSFGDLLRYYRLFAGLTQADLAARAGVGQETIGALERGVNNLPRRSTVERLSTALGLDAEERAEFEAYAKPRPRGQQNLALRTQAANCATCRFNCALAPAPWGVLLTTICRHQR